MLAPTEYIPHPSLMLTTMGVNLIRASQVPSVAFRLGTGACRHVVYRTHGLSTTVRPGSRVVFRPHQQPGVRPEVIQPRAAAGPAGDLPSAGRPGSPELDQPRLFRAVSFGDIYFYINVVYWCVTSHSLWSQAEQAMRQAGRGPASLTLSLTTTTHSLQVASGICSCQR